MVLNPAPKRRTDPRIVLAKTCVHLAALAPLAILSWQVWDVARTGGDALGADPVAEIEHRLGLWALRFLMCALAVTPLRQLTGKPVLVRFRRMLGLYAFFYACLHFGAYLGLDLRGYWTQVFEDIAKRPYITIGFSAWLMLLTLAVTSPKAMVRRLGGKRWRAIHRLVYVVPVLGVIHFTWAQKKDIRLPLLYGLVLGVIFAVRLAQWAAGRARLGHTAPVP